MKVNAVFCVLSPAAATKGIGDIAVYIYNLKNLPYTVRIITKESIVIKIDSSNVTAQRGMNSKNPVLLTNQWFPEVQRFLVQLQDLLIRDCVYNFLNNFKYRSHQFYSIRDKCSCNNDTKKLECWFWSFDILPVCTCTYHSP